MMPVAMPNDRTGERSIPLLEHMFVIGSLLMFASAIVPVVRENRGVIFDPAAGDSALRSIFIGIYAVMFVLIAYRLEDFIRAAFRNKVTIALTLLPTLSVVWSTNPDITLRRSTALLLTSIFGIYVASRYSRRQLVTLLAATIGVALVLSCFSPCSCRNSA